MRKCIFCVCLMEYRRVPVLKMLCLGWLVQVMAERNHGALNLIQLDDHTFTIHKQTYANNYTER